MHFVVLDEVAGQPLYVSRTGSAVPEVFSTEGWAALRSLSFAPGVVVLVTPPKFLLTFIEQMRVAWEDDRDSAMVRRLWSEVCGKLHEVETRMRIRTGREDMRDYVAAFILLEASLCSISTFEILLRQEFARLVACVLSGEVRHVVDCVPPRVVEGGVAVVADRVISGRDGVFRLCASHREAPSTGIVAAK